MGLRTTNMMATPIAGDEDNERPLPSPVSSASPSKAAPLTPEHMEQLARARLREKKIRRATAVAMVNGCILTVFSGCSFLFSAVGALFGGIDFVGLIMGVGLAVVAWNEFRGRGMLLRLEPRGCRVLGWNQLGLMVLVIGYAAWMLGRALWAPRPYAEAMVGEAALAGPLGAVDELYEMISIAIYGGLIVGTMIFQGINSLYYFTRRRHVEAYLRGTPEWIVELRRREAGGG